MDRLCQFWTEPLQIWQKYDGMIADGQVYFKFATSLSVEERFRRNMANNS